MTKRREHGRAERSLLSFRHRAALARTLAAAGRGAAVVDVRGATGDEIVEAVAFASASAGAPLIVIGARDDGAAIDRLIEAGATHHLVAPFALDDLARALRLADRHAGRTAAVPQQAAVDARERIATRLAGGGTGSLLLVAVTRFQAVNTAFGRATGDALLFAAGQRLAALAPVDAIVGRIGGAEFAVMTGESAEALAGRILERIERPFLAEGHLVSVGCCIGIAESMAGDDAVALLRRAGFALARARADGGSVHMLAEADEGAALFDAGLEADLRRALDADEIEMLFQPQVSVTTGAVVGVEALARWRHPRHGELGAETLFAVAARSNYLGALSSHVQQRAAAIAAGWPDALSGLRLSINLTAADFARAGFVDAFFAMIDASGFPRARLTVEITESALIEDLEAAATSFAALRAGGCRVAIDDFGTGYSSLAYLKALPLDYLKIDKHLAQDIAGTRRDRIVVRGVIEMARSLGLSVIAEGVETEEQLALLAAEGCQYYQGFLFSEPLTTEMLAAVV